MAKSEIARIVKTRSKAFNYMLCKNHKTMQNFIVVHMSCKTIPCQIVEFYLVSLLVEYRTICFGL